MLQGLNGSEAGLELSVFVEEEDERCLYNGAQYSS